MDVLLKSVYSICFGEIDARSCEEIEKANRNERIWKNCFPDDLSALFNVWNQEIFQRTFHSQKTFYTISNLKILSGSPGMSWKGQNKSNSRLFMVQSLSE